MNAPTKKLDELVRAGKIAHGNHPVLRWMAGNVSIEQDAADNWKPSKKKSTERIDGIVALIMGLDRATTQESHESAHDRERRGFWGISGKQNHWYDACGGRFRRPEWDERRRWYALKGKDRGRRVAYVDADSSVVEFFFSHM